MLSPQFFAKIIEDFPYQKKFLVAVSGGADSLALTLLFNEFLMNLYKTNRNLMSVTINHNQSINDEKEADFTHNLLTSLNIHHEIVTLTLPKLRTKIEETLRNARYKALVQFSIKNNIKTIAVAHNANDQIETFFMRLARGSGLNGLCSIRPTVNSLFPVTSNSSADFIEETTIKIFRPLLQVFHKDLVETLQERFKQKFIEDPENNNFLYERVRWRSFLNKIPLNETNNKNILNSIKHLQEIEKQLICLAKNFEEQYVEKKEGDNINSNTQTILNFPIKEFLELMPQVAKTVLLHLISQIGFSNRPFSQQKLDALYEKIYQPNFKAANFHGCLIKKTALKKITIIPEIR